jgi:hypothetical protein
VIAARKMEEKHIPIDEGALIEYFIAETKEKKKPLQLRHLKPPLLYKPPQLLLLQKQLQLRRNPFLVQKP